MLLIFGRNNHWISRLIRWRTKSLWSHVGIIDGDNVIEARGGFGVVLTQMCEFMHRYDYTEIHSLPGDVQKAKKLIGKRFDDKGVWGHMFCVPFIHDLDAWFCSEIVAYAADDIPDNAAHLFNPDSIYKRCLLNLFNHAS
jgi:hypothetical protein